MFLRWSLFWRRILQRIFRFDPWHVSPYLTRCYAQFVVAELNSAADRKRVVEIGCGLADILRRLRYDEKLGLDQEAEVLRAAAFLSLFNVKNWGKIRFMPAQFPDVALQGSYDAIIMVNWIHNVDPQILKSGIDTLFTKHLNVGGQLVIDLVENKNYQFNHNIDSLSKGLSGNIRISKPFEFGRRIAFITKTGH